MLEDQQQPSGELEPAASRVFNNKTRLLVVGVVIFLALGYLVYAAFPGSTLYYVTVNEFLADEQNMDGRSLRVVGKLVPDSFQRVPGTTRANFTLTEEGKVLQGSYVGVLPDLFFNPHSDVVLEGSYGEGNVFNASTVIVKCPSKYQALREDA